jgi:endonuclease-3 related protein
MFYKGSGLCTTGDHGITGTPPKRNAKINRNPQYRGKKSLKARGEAMTTSVKDLYEILFNTFGNQHWWPIDTRYHERHHSDPRFEIIIGAILTQNTAWTNVEKALDNLKKQKTFTIAAITQTSEKNLRLMIQPSGFFNQKAHRLNYIATYLEKKYSGDLQEFFSQDAASIRHTLLSLPGIGPETADSILLYAGNHPVFVIDAYTKRICQRLPFPVRFDSYEEIQQFFEKQLSSTVSKEERTMVYKEYHALLVKLAKHYCLKKKPHCSDCPISTLCKKLL